MNAGARSRRNWPRRFATADRATDGAKVKAGTINRATPTPAPIIAGKAFGIATQYRLREDASSPKVERFQTHA